MSYLPAAAPRTPARRRPVLLVGAMVGAAGLAGVVVGTFAPWVISGGVERNSYAIVGIVDRLGLVGTGFGSTALSLWPFVGPVAMIALIAGILRWWRAAALIALLFGLLTGVIGGGVLAVAGGHGGAGIGLADAGPVITLIGGVAAVLGAVLILIGGRRRRTATDVGHIPYQWNREPVLPVEVRPEHRIPRPGTTTNLQMYPGFEREDPR